MKSITIHGIDRPLEKLLKVKAEEEKTSMNKTIKKILEEALGVRPSPDDPRRKEFAEFLGIWSKADLEQFNREIGDFESIHEEDWA